MISIKDYAAKNNVSYEAVRQQVKRYSKDLEGHIIKVSRTQYLDDDAVAFLDDKRRKNPVIVQETSKDNEIQALYQENKALLLKVTELQDQLLKERELVKALQGQLIDVLQSTEKNEDVESNEFVFVDEAPEDIQEETEVSHNEEDSLSFWQKIKRLFY